jgi:uncharacterized protein (DUF342 family)
MTITLIQGEFSREDATQLLSNLIKVKIEFHENKIVKDSSEELIKFRESKIKSLQSELTQMQKHLKTSQGNISLNTQIQL